MSQKAIAKRVSARTLVCTATYLAAAAWALPGVMERAWGAPGSPAPESCFTTLAATRNYSLGRPTHAVPAPDGKSVFYLRSGPRDTKLGLFQYDLEAGTERALARPEAGPEHLSVEEKARRERARMTLTGITDFALSRDGKTVLVSQADTLSTISLPGHEVRPVPGTGWIAPRLAPDGTAVAAVRDNDVHVVDLASGRDTQLTTGGTETITHGLPEFAAAEELDRLDGVWWSPDSSKLVYEDADNSGLEKHFIADPEHPDRAPVEFRYPRAGTANAKVRLGIIARTGGPTRWIDWDPDAYPYVARVVWQQSGKLSVVLLNRAETEEIVLAVDAATGRTTKLLTETDSAWLNIVPGYGGASGGARPLPYWLPDGSGFLWAAERGGTWQLELRHPDGTLAHAVTPPNLPFEAVNDVDMQAASVLFTGRPDRIDTALYRVPLAGGAPVAVAAEPGMHNAEAGENQHAIMVDRYAGADGSAGVYVRAADGTKRATLPSYAETPGTIPAVEFTTAGARAFDAIVLRPTGYRPGTRLPVVLSVYAGPGVKLVNHTPREFLEDQCLADHGFAVVTLDGRGTPGRDHDFERATKFNLIDLPLQDQIDGLHALGKRHPELDMSRVGVTGWSFGGYFTAMATIRRPDVFRVGVAGAPVVDFQDYDTAYTERYLGLPAEHPEAYRVSNVLSYAGQLRRPLLLMHGVTDDNVYFQNTVKLTQALIKAGRPYSLLLLPGTHQLPDPLLRTRVDEARVAYLREHLK